MSSDQESSTTGISSAYVREMLELNPVSQSAQIIRRRRELWRPNEKPRNAAAQVVDPRTAARLRDRGKQCLNALQQNFYSLPAQKIEQYLQFMEQDQLPEFAVHVAKFRKVLRYRKALVQLDREMPDKKFAYSLLHGLVKPAAEAGALHEQFIESVRHERRSKTATKMISEFVQRYPALYELEKDWIDAILNLRSRSPASSKIHGIVLGIMMLPVLIFASVVGSKFKDDNKTNAMPYIPRTHSEYNIKQAVPKPSQITKPTAASTKTSPTNTYPARGSQQIDPDLIHKQIIEQIEKDYERSVQEAEERSRLDQIRRSASLREARERHEKMREKMKADMERRRRETERSVLKNKLMIEELKRSNGDLERARRNAEARFLDQAKPGSFEPPNFPSPNPRGVNGKQETNRYRAPSFPTQPNSN